MNKIILKELEIENFKNINNLKLDFNDGVTKIHAPNGSGKTTLKESFFWVLGQTVSDFIPNGKSVITKVTALLNINDYDYKLTKINTPKIVDGVSTGNETKCYIDDIEIGTKNYNAKVLGLFGENIPNIQMVTDINFFNSNSTKWKWNNRRDVLMEMAGVYEKTKDIINKDKYILIREDIVKGHSTSEISSKILKNKRDFKQKQEQIALLIQQKQSDINEYLGYDFDTLSMELSVAKQKLTKLNSRNDDDTKTAKYNEISKNILDKTKEITKLKLNDTNEISQLNNLKSKLYTEAKLLAPEIGEHTDICLCPVCKQTLPEEMIIERQKKQDEFLSLYNNKKKEFDDVCNKIKDFKPNEKINILENELKELNLALENVCDENTSNETQEEKTKLETTINDLTIKMSKKSEIEKADKQIKDWKKQQMQLADDIVSCETIEKTVEQYMKEQTNIVINTINNYFQNGISWKLYNENYNDSLDEDCECLYNGKDYNTMLSTGERYKAGVEVMKVIQDYYNLNSLVWIDDCESITIPYNTQRQTIELYATIPSEMDKKEFIELKEKIYE